MGLRDDRFLVQVEGRNGGQPFAVRYFKKVRGSDDLIEVIDPRDGSVLRVSHRDRVPEGGF